MAKLVHVKEEGCDQVEDCEVVLACIYGAAVLSEELKFDPCTITEVKWWSTRRILWLIQRRLGAPGGGAVCRGGAVHQEVVRCTVEAP